MNTTWNFILAGAVTLVSVAGIVSGEAAKGELRLVEGATSISAINTGAGRPGKTLTRLAGEPLTAGSTP